MEYKELAKSLLREGRSEGISKEKFLELYGNISYDLSNWSEDEFIYRGVHFDHNFGMIDPRKHKTRTSAYSRNYYTLVINNSDKWSKYPKRDLVCVTDSHHAWNYGRVFIMIPFDVSEWGICPYIDIHGSFTRLQKFGFSAITSFNSFLDDLFEKFGFETPESSYENFITALNLVSTEMKKQNGFKNLHDLKKSRRNFFREYVKSKYYEEDKLGLFVDNLMAPDTNRFQYQKSWSGVDGRHEVWTDGPCLMISKEKYEEIDLS